MNDLTTDATPQIATRSSPPAPGTMAATITDRLVAALAPTALDVANESALHAGHRGDDGSGESHFRVTIEAPAFAGRSRLERQRMVNRALGELIDRQHIHALAIHASAPGEG